MADDVEEQENGEFSLPSPCLHDSDTEVVLHREVLDSGLNPDGEINVESVEKFDHGFENWSWKPSSPVDNTFDLDKDSHIESIEDESTTSGDEKSATNENLGRTDSAVFDSEGIIENEPLTKTLVLESHVDKSPDMEFRHRYSNNDRLTPRDEETRVLLQNSDHSSEVVEHISKSYKKAEEGPSAKEEASEQRLQDGTKSKRDQGL